MTHEAIRETYPQVVEIIEDNGFILKDKDGNILSLDLSIVPPETEKQMLSKYKFYYLEVFNDKLKELDYDGIQTLTFWKDHATFGAEATSLLNWYEQIITKNYEILNDIKSGLRAIPSKEQYISELPIYQGL